RSFLKENLERIRPVITRDELISVQDMLATEITLSDAMVHLMNSVTVATRRSDPSYPAGAFEREGLGAEVVSEAGGASSRTTSFWPALLRAHAFYHGRDRVVPHDVFATALAMLNHRLET